MMVEITRRIYASKLDRNFSDPDACAATNNLLLDKNFHTMEKDIKSEFGCLSSKLAPYLRYVAVNLGGEISICIAFNAATSTLKN
jgi:hypothetical protein